jgi:hypothetical protein
MQGRVDLMVITVAAVSGFRLPVGRAQGDMKMQAVAALVRQTSHRDIDVPAGFLLQQRHPVHHRCLTMLFCPQQGGGKGRTQFIPQIAEHVAGQPPGQGPQVFTQITKDMQHLALAVQQHAWRGVTIQDQVVVTQQVPVKGNGSAGSLVK